MVVCLSNCTTGAELKDTSKVDSLIVKAKGFDKKTVVLSTYLPYDLEKFGNADALEACYGPGINVTAAIYKMFE